MKVIIHMINGDKYTYVLTLEALGRLQNVLRNPDGRISFGDRTIFVRGISCVDYGSK